MAFEGLFDRVKRSELSVEIGDIDAKLENLLARATMAR